MGIKTEFTMQVSIGNSDRFPLRKIMSFSAAATNRHALLTHLHDTGARRNSSAHRGFEEFVGEFGFIFSGEKKLRRRNPEQLESHGICSSHSKSHQTLQEMVGLVCRMEFAVRNVEGDFSRSMGERAFAKTRWGCGCDFL